VRRVRPTGRIAILGKRPLSAASPLDAALRSYNERPPELTPAIDASEAFLVAVFLRRYVTYCARRGRYAAMNGAARLHAEIGTAAK
jgi:hypothetical protein